MPPGTGDPRIGRVSGELAYLRCDKEGKVFLSHEDINKICAVTARLVEMKLKRVLKQVKNEKSCDTR